MDIGNFCQICVDTNVKMYNENKHNLGAVFQDLMGTSIPKIQYGNYFCYLCAGTLYKFSKFKQKYALAQKVLKEIFQSRVTPESFQYARHQHNLATLSFSGTLIEMNENPLDPSDVSASMVKVEVPLLDDPLESDVKFKQEADTYSQPTILIEIDDTLKPMTANVTTDNSSTVNVGQAKSETSADEHNDDINNEDLELVQQKTEQTVIEIDTDEECHKEPKTKSRRTKPHSMKYLRQRSRGHKFDAKCWKVVELSEEEMYEDYRRTTDSDTCKDSVYRCDLCFRRFRKEETLARHVGVHSKTQGEYKCKLCKRRFMIMGKLRVHMKVHKMRYHCLKCPFVGRSTDMAIRHEKFHAGLNYNCKLCNISFTNQSTYYTHRKVVHRSRHVCALCGESYVSPLGLRMHAARSHRESTGKKHDAKAPAEATCQLSQSQLSQSELFCDRCQIDFKTREAFDEHKNHSALHLDEDAQEDTQKQLKSRKRYLKCIPCDKTFSSKYGHKKYRAHMSAAHGAAPPARLVCELCGLYVAYSSIAVHRKKHAKEGTLKASEDGSAQQYYPSLSCDNCGQRFRRRNRLSFHLKRCVKPN